MTAKERKAEERQGLKRIVKEWQQGGWRKAEEAAGRADEGGKWECVV